MKKRVLPVLLCLLLLTLLLSLTPLAAEGGEVTEDESPFTLLYQTLIEHLDTVFGALAAIGTAAVALSYKKGILPLLKSGVTLLSDKVVKIGEKSDRIEKDTAENADFVKKNLQSMLSCLEKYERSLAKLEETLVSLSEKNADIDLLKLLMRGETELLYEIFTSSSLPQYQKERVTRRMEELTAALGGDGDVG